MAKGALLYVFDLKYHLDIEYTYLIPEHISNMVRGCFTIVPFGKGNRKVIALCKELIEVDDTSGLKYIISTISENFTLSEEMMTIVEYLKENTFCTTSDAVKRIIPCDSLNKAIEYYVISPNKDISSLNGKISDVYSYIKNNQPVDISLIPKDIFGNNIKTYLNKLEDEQYIKRDLILKEQIKDAKEIYAYINNDCSFDELATKRTPDSYKEIYSRIKDSNIIPIKELQNEGFSYNQIKAMEKKGYIKFEEHEKLRIPYSSYTPTKKEYILSNEQQNAFDTLKNLVDSNKSNGALLYGITGSGKSSVILELCKYVTSKNKTAIIMVPEIALTWQSVEMFMQYYGRRLQVINSSLSNGERFDAYKRIKRGEVSVVLGTRSAIFAPLDNLGLIVIDEEQEHTYKSDSSPKYLTHDLSRLRCKINNSLLVLSSATPSIETYFRAKNGIYTLVKLNNRYGNATLPDTIISDMRKEGKHDILGMALKQALIDNVKDYKQSLLLLNRRGFSSSVICHKCGEVIMCPNCSVAMTVHKTRNGDVMMCHYCGYQKPMVKMCPSCKSEHISTIGYGTQAIEEEVKKLIPNVKTIRMDADTVTHKNARDEIVSSFAKGEYDVLIGTQMIAKGHNFPYVTLSSCVNIDSSLYSNDFRASERTFDLLTQLEGRSGRSEYKGKALIQTYHPLSEIISLAQKQDYEAFYEQEIKQRKTFMFPPFCDIAIISFSSENEDEMIKTAYECYRNLNDILSNNNVPMQIFGPFENPIYKLKNKYRMRIVIKHKFNSSSRNIFKELMINESKNNNGVVVTIDINPTQT